MGFEPMQDLHPLAVFETAPFDRLGISPFVYYNTIYRYTNLISEIIDFKSQ